MKHELIQRLLRICRIHSAIGLSNGNRAMIPELHISVVSSQSFLGQGGNPAIFVNHKTYRLMKEKYQAWKLNATIALKQGYLEHAALVDIIGAIIHEAGHAFNVHAGIPNTETNAYIFEIEVMRKLFKNALFRDNFKLTESDLEQYFKRRLSYFRMSCKHSSELAELVQQLQATTSEPTPSGTEAFINANDNSADVSQATAPGPSFFATPGLGATLFSGSQITLQQNKQDDAPLASSPCSKR